jgi:hypothetical protein
MSTGAPFSLLIAIRRRKKLTRRPVQLAGWLRVILMMFATVPRGR